MTYTVASAIHDDASVLVIVSDVGSGHIRSMNRAAEQCTGFTRGQVGVPLWELAAPEYREMLCRVLQDPLGPEFMPSFESTVKLRSGASHRIVWSSTILADEAGARSHVVSTGVDMSSEAASGGLRARLIRAANTTAWISTDRHGYVACCSPEAERMLGLVGAKMVGRPLPISLFDPSEIRLRAQELGIPDGVGVLTFGGGKHDPPSRSGELLPKRDWTLVRADGSRLIASVAVSVARDAGGRPLGYIGFAHDVTERRRLNQVRKESLETKVDAVELFHELDRIKSEFVAILSHELRTPTASIVASAELLQDGLAGELNSKQRSLVDVVARNSERLITLADDLVTLARVDAGDPTVQLIAMDLRDVVSGAREALQTLLLERHLETFVEMPEEPVMVRGDATHLQLAVVNLVSNAVKFTDDGGSISCRLTADEDEAIIEVSDTGIGIPRIEQRDLFTRFFRSSTSLERATQGVGIGLSIVSSVVNRHGGQISVDSDHLQGCTFTVRIPLLASRPIAGSVGTAPIDAETPDSGRLTLIPAELTAAGEDRLLLEAELRLALAEPVNQFVLHYQPVVDLSSGKVVAVESLVRWQHPVRGHLELDRFGPLAEADGLIHELGDWVLNQAMRDSPQLTHEGRDLDIAVKLSVRQLDEQTVAKVRSAIEDSDLSPVRLIIEVTESAIVEDEKTTAATLESLSNLGVRIALDDFGTGCSSLHYLRRYPVNALKIDREFVAGIATSQDDAAICASIINLAASVGATSVGEGVDTSEQYAVLRSVGCLQGQGFLWSPPVPIDELADALAACERVPVAAPRSRTARTPSALDSKVAAIMTKMHAEGASFHTIAAELNRSAGHNPKVIRWTAGSVAGQLRADDRRAHQRLVRPLVT